MKENIRELNKNQYLQTMGNNMKNATNEAYPSVDIWNYAKLLLDNNLISKYGFDNQIIEAVYVNDENTYHHILLFTDKPNCYVVIVVNVIQRTIFGHYILDLNKEYDINE